MTGDEFFRAINLALWSYHYRIERERFAAWAMLGGDLIQEWADSGGECG